MSYQYKLSKEQEMILATVRQIVKEKIAVRAAEIDKSGKYPWDIVRLYQDSKILSLPIPEKYGGVGASEFTCCLVVEEIAKTCGNSAHALSDHWLGITPLLVAGSEEQKEEYLTKMATNPAAFSLTEPEAGTDAAAVQTKAVLQGNEYVLNGRKCFCTCANEAEFITVFAKTQPDAGSRGLSAFVLEKKKTPGLSIGKIEDQIGMRGTPACEVILSDCHTASKNRLGKEGDGFRIAMRTLDRTRPMTAALVTGIAQGALDYAIDYAKRRVQFGKPISELQAIQLMLADAATGIEASRHLVYEAAHFIDSGQPNTKVSAMAKYFATDMAVKVTNDAMQVLGGYGLLKDFPLEQKMRDARMHQILEGTNQILRVVVARSLLA
jgi:alkylation response protein AidB-like acyl-CoA dehydrogenase